MKYFKLLIRGAKSQGRPDIHNPGGPELSWLCALVLTDIMSMLFCQKVSYSTVHSFAYEKTTASVAACAGLAAA